MMAKLLTGSFGGLSDPEPFFTLMSKKQRSFGQLYFIFPSGMILKITALI
jgi:hypothetical protein